MASFEKLFTAAPAFLAASAAAFFASSGSGILESESAKDLSRRSASVCDVGNTLRQVQGMRVCTRVHFSGGHAVATTENVFQS